MAVNGNAAMEVQKNMLLLWQRAVFKEGKTPRTIADSLRMRIHLLQTCCDKNRDDVQYYHSLQSTMERYGSIVDCQHPNKGLNNFAEPIQSLVKDGKNCSREWKCTVDIDEILQLPECKALTKPLESNKPFPELNDISQIPINKSVSITSPFVVTTPTNTSMATPIASISSITENSSTKSFPIQSTSEGHGSVTRINKFHYATQQPTSCLPPSCSTSSCPPPSCPSPSYLPPVVASSSNTKKSNEYVSSGYQKKKHDRSVPWTKRKRRGQKYDDSDDDDDDMSCDSNVKGGAVRGVSSFVTAKDQFVINQYKKKGRGRGYQTAVHNEDDDMDTEGGSISTCNYGNNKRSLGTRRPAGNKFVPPVKRSSEDDDINEKIKSHVLYNNNKGGENDEGGSNLPPELEGDERLKNIEPKMIELIMNEIMDHGVPIQWEDIAGLEFAKTTIKEIVVWPMLRPDIFKGLRGPPKGILLFGPPGTGKTLIGKCIASQVQATFFSISASSLTSKWVGEGEKMVRALFAVSRCYQPAVIFIDEIDSLLSQRSDTEHESSRRIKTEFLVQLDGATTNNDDRLLVVGATNRPHEIDEAARRRLVKRLYIPLPDQPARKQIVSNLLKDQLFELTEQEMESICETSKGYSGADMTNLCREAALGPIRDAAHDIQNIAVDQVRPVKYCDFEEAFHIIRPSVSEKDLEHYITWNNQYGCSSRR